ncbi:MAG TPA: isocitrate/isopropylmalate dehydrogenase family protein [Burkholderiales bacterium]|nr:isocitrate/isopropylmalate dehydrogenase family protein [Burkholderiales bacterium]
MASGSQLRIAVLPGDGIGVEVMDACLRVLEALSSRMALRFDWNRLPGGANAYRETGSAFTEEAMRECERADAILFGAMGLPDVRYPDGTEIAPQLDIRVHLALYAGVRPIRALPGLPTVLRDPRAENIDLVILREQTEGLYWSRGRGVMQDADTAVDTMRITRAGCERVFEYAFRLARTRRSSGRPGKVTCVDKSGVLLSQAFMHRVFSEVATRHPDAPADFCNVDAMALNLVRQPWNYDVLVTENMFGDILSDLAAGLIGGMGMAPSGDIGDAHGMFQPCHGTAPDIAGSGKANPTAMFLSAAMMLEWLGERQGDARLSEAARLLEDAVRSVFARQRAKPFEFGGSDGTREITQAVLEALASSGGRN